MRRFSWVLSALLLASCTDGSGGPDGSTPDADTSHDGSVPTDGGPSDGSLVDAALGDGAPGDAPADAAVSDAADAASADAAMVDAASVDAATGPFVSSFEQILGIRVKGRPAVAFDGTDYLVVWVEANLTGVATTPFDIRAVRVTRAGDQIGAPVLVATANFPLPTAGSAPVAVAWSGQSYLITWAQTAGSVANPVIAGARVAANGTVLDATPISILTMSAAGNQVDGVAIEWNGTSYLITFNQFGMSAFAIRATAGGVLVGTITQVSTLAEGGGEAGEVSSNGSGWLVSWDVITQGSTTTDLGYLTTMAANGTRGTTAPLPIALPADLQSAVRTASDGTGYLAAWIERQAVRVARVSGAGAVLDSPALVAETNPLGQNLLLGYAANHYWLGWNLADGLHLARLSATTGLVTDTGGLAVTGVPTTQSSALSVDPSGDSALVAWTAGSMVHVRVATLAGAAPPSDGGVALGPDAALVPDGGFLLDHLIRASTDSSGAAANQDSQMGGLSGDGRFVLFTTRATNLPGGSRGEAQVYLKDLLTGRTTLESVDSSGTPGNGLSAAVAISPDGRYILFTSDANNLVPGDSNSTIDLFLHDHQTGVTERVNVSTAGAQADQFSDSASMTADARLVVFATNATTLGPRQPGGVFIRDRQLGTTTAVAGLPIFVDQVVFSPDGRYLALRAGPMKDVQLLDRQTGTLSNVSGYGDFDSGITLQSYPAAVLSTGQVLFHAVADHLVAGDTNRAQDVFLSGPMVLISVDAAGQQANDDSQAGSLCADGRFIVFQSLATNLVAGAGNSFQDVFLKDQITGAVTRLSAGPGGVLGNGHSRSATISADGAYIAFQSEATNLIAGDTATKAGVFVGPRP